MRCVQIQEPSPAGVMKIVNYDTNLTDAQWDFLQPMLPKRKKRGCPSLSPRLIINASSIISSKGASNDPMTPVFLLYKKTKNMVIRLVGAAKCQKECHGVIRVFQEEFRCRAIRRADSSLSKSSLRRG